MESWDGEQRGDRMKVSSCRIRTDYLENRVVDYIPEYKIYLKLLLHNIVICKLLYWYKVFDKI